MTTAPRPVTGRTRDAVIFADKAIFRLAKHWLLVANVLMALFVGLPLLAPVLMDAGLTTPAKIIYTIYRPTCHQRPARSFFYGGPKLAYSADELAAAGVDVNPLARALGNETVGWKTAFCERDVAIYGSILLGGLAYGLVRRRRRPGQLMRFRYYIPFVLPMAVDGTLQLFGFYESTWLLRLITGTIFGLGSVAFAYPYLEEAFADARRTVNDKLHLE